MNLMIAYSVHMDQVMESFNSGHRFSIVDMAEAKLSFQCNHQNLVIIFGLIIRI